MINKEIETLLKETLSKVKTYETESDFLDEVKNSYIADHVNEKNVMNKAKELRDGFINDLTCIEAPFDLRWELEYVYGYNFDNLDADELESLKNTLKTLVMVYIDETDTYYII